jgi:hypothetical protein
MRTIPTSVQVDDIADSDIDYTEESLILLLELLLVKYLQCQHTVFRNSTAATHQHTISKYLQIGGASVQIEALIPVGIEGLLDHAGGSCLLAVDRRDCEWIREACGGLVEA